MKSKKNLVILIVILVVVIAVATVAYNMLAPTVGTQTLQQQGTTSTTNDGAKQDAINSGNALETETVDAPNFTMTSVDGQKTTLASLEGRPLVLNFWASTCGPCKKEMPEFQTAYEKYGKQVQFVMVNIPGFNGETRDRALQLIDQQSYTFPVFFDSDAEAKTSYGINSIPRTYFINPDGTVATYAMGRITYSEIEQGIELIL